MGFLVQIHWDQLVFDGFWSPTPVSSTRREVVSHIFENCPCGSWMQSSPLSKKELQHRALQHCSEFSAPWRSVYFYLHVSLCSTFAGHFLSLEQTVGSSNKTPFLRTGYEQLPGAAGGRHLQRYMLEWSPDCTRGRWGSVGKITTSSPRLHHRCYPTIQPDQVNSKDIVKVLYIYIYTHTYIYIYIICSIYKFIYTIGHCRKIIP